VLAEWIQGLARHNGWIAQGTSVPGVAQRTGSTVYYVELAKPSGPAWPVMAQMPVPGDVDVVLASELMETGRAIVRGFVTAGRTTLIGSTHRIYAISEKVALGDGRADSSKVVEAAGRRSKRYIGFDMDAAAERASSVISSVMFGALAGSSVLPFSRAAFEDAIRDSGVAVSSNLRGFDEGFRAAQGDLTMPDVVAVPVPSATTPAGKALQARIEAVLPSAAMVNAIHGVKRVVDYQDVAYAELYLDRVADMAQVDAAPFVLTAETARHVALWMTYEDAARVADLKTRGSRLERVRDEVKAGEQELVRVTEFMHPRLQEICDLLPAHLGRALLRKGALYRFLQRFVTSGWYVETTSLRWFVALRLLAALRSLRRRSLRFSEEQQRIEAWLSRARDAAARDNATAVEVIRCQRLINFNAIMEAYDSSPYARTALVVRRLRELALADERGEALNTELERIRRSSISVETATLAL
jgi:indolepyruvate ferredoxin oxidoreductase beta subunit